MTSAPNDKCHNFCQILKMANRYLKLAKERKPFSSKQYRNQSVQCNTPQTNIKIFRSTWGDKDSRVLTWALLGSVSGPFPVELTKAFSLIELTLTANFYCCCCLGQSSFHSMFFGLYNHVHFFKISSLLSLVFISGLLSSFMLFIYRAVANKSTLRQINSVLPIHNRSWYVCLMLLLLLFKCKTRHFKSMKQNVFIVKHENRKVAKLCCKSLECFY